MLNFKYFFLLILLCLSCSSDTKNNPGLKGEKLVLSLARELEKIQTADDLKKHSPKIRKRINQITELMIEGKKNRKSQGKEDSLNHLASDRLLYEFHRLSKDAQCQKILKNLQRDALEKIISFKEKKNKTRERN